MGEENGCTRVVPIDSGDCNSSRDIEKKNLLPKKASYNEIRGERVSNVKVMLAYSEFVVGSIRLKRNVVPAQVSEL